VTDKAGAGRRESSRPYTKRLRHTTHTHQTEATFRDTLTHTQHTTYSRKHTDTEKARSAAAHGSLQTRQEQCTHKHKQTQEGKKHRGPAAGDRRSGVATHGRSHPVATPHRRTVSTNTGGTRQRMAKARQAKAVNRLWNMGPLGKRNRFSRPTRS
jgi:hypothetical protein